MKGGTEAGDAGSFLLGSCILYHVPADRLITWVKATKYQPRRARQRSLEHNNERSKSIDR